MNKKPTGYSYHEATGYTDQGKKVTEWQVIAEYMDEHGEITETDGIMAFTKEEAAERLVEHLTKELQAQEVGR